MTIRNRETLRHFFDEGRLPTRDHFGDLIDSMLNMSDEGFRKSAENGLEVSTPVGYDALISFYREQSARTALWSMGYGGDRDQLLFQHASVAASRGKPPVMALDAQGSEGRVGIGTADPQEALDVAGVVASTGRRGTCRPADAPALLADGDWHDLTPELTGCQAFEVMAGVGDRGTGRYALLQAVAMNTFNPTAGWFDFLMRKKRIQAHSVWYGKRCDQLELRWNGTSGRDARYTLQIRTRCDYGSGVRIQVSLSRLWFDERMQGSAP
ncbi:hypothetical protein [Roseateles amylovorans]|uniref:Uncharacterized protein n=1 Tax=Roseateles amylovorans TaxID=2978473 RepID=A0ABY6B2K6_9BURK|nr:hypothetical protein [Roseateles amylovorans]UXH79418.1 hypothetical protein N4261_05675 [Roseateles amylovorans]